METAGTIAILYRALAAKLGVEVRSDDIMEAKRALYKARSKLNDPDLDDIAVRACPSDPENAVWVVRNSKLPEEARSARRTNKSAPALVQR